MMSPFDGRRQNPEKAEFKPHGPDDADLSDYSTQLHDVLSQRMLITPMGRDRPMRCRTGYVLSEDQTCAACGVERDQPCGKCN